MAQINETPPPLPEGLDPRLVKLVLDCMAKKPDQRPSSALELAARAEALLVDGVDPIRIAAPTDDSVSDETMLIDTDTKPTGKAPAIWPWLVLIVILLVTIGAVFWAGLLAPKDQVSPSPSPSPSNTETESPSPSPTPTETPETVAVLLSDYQGQDVSLVIPMLTALGLEVEPIAGLSVPADDPKISQVYDISPLGSVPIGSTIQVYYYQQIFDENTVPNQ